MKIFFLIASVIVFTLSKAQTSQSSSLSLFVSDTTNGLTTKMNFSRTTKLKSDITRVRRRILDEGDPSEIFKDKSFMPHISIGPTYVFDSTFKAYISPIDKTLKLQRSSPWGFNISTGVSFPLLGKNFFGGKKVRTFDNQGNIISSKFTANGIYAIININVLTYTSAYTGLSFFNKGIDGGIGLAYKTDDNFFIGLVWDFISLRQPMDEIKALRNTQLFEGGGTEPVTSLDINDDRYFYNKYVQAISLKFILTIPPVKGETVTVDSKTAKGLLFR